MRIVRENYTGVVLEHLNRFKTRVNFFVNKYFHSGVLTYLWEREMIICIEIPIVMDYEKYNANFGV